LISKLTRIQNYRGNDSEVCTMTGKEVQAFLKEHLVPKKLYKIGGSHKNRICLEQTEKGWEVFFRDKKEKVGTLFFRDEASACQCFMEEVRKIMVSLYGITWVPSV